MSRVALVCCSTGRRRDDPFNTLNEMRRITHHLGKAACLACLIGAIILTGCCSKDPPRGFVYREWASRMAELGIYPVFPPREDVHVGDVYLLPLHPFDAEVVGAIGGLGMAGIHVNYLYVSNQTPVATYLTEYYQERPAFPGLEQTAEGAKQGTDEVPFEKMVATTNNADIFKAQVPVRLKQVAFPEFSVTKITEGDVSALVPIEAVMADVGFKFSEVKSVSIKVAAAESYGLSTDWLLRNTLKQFVARDSRGQTWLKASPHGDQEENIIASMSGPLARAMFTESLTRALSSAKRPDLVAKVQETSDMLYLALISEVFYARSFDITVQHSSGKGARARARVAGKDAVDKLLKGEASPATNSVAPKKEPSEPEKGGGKSAFEMAKDLRDFNQGFSTGPAGGSVQILSVSETAIGMRRRFERPIAVGVRGVLLKISAFPEAFTPVGSKEPTTGYRVFLGEPEPVLQQKPPAKPKQPKKRKQGTPSQ
jgi:hypothetical protein